VAVGFGVEYGTGKPGVRSVIEMANLDGSGLIEATSFGFGTGMYVLTRETLDCFCTEYSGSGAPSACTLTAIPLKQGIVFQQSAAATEAAQWSGNSRVRGCLCCRMGSSKGESCDVIDT
jgi:hypothetical protein